MNLDTPSKRASSVGLLLCFVLASPLPDGTLDQGDRQHIADSYSGILSIPSPTTITGTPWQLNTDGYLATTVELNTGGYLATVELNTGGYLAAKELNTGGVLAAQELNTDGISVGTNG